MSGCSTCVYRLTGNKYWVCRLDRDDCNANCDPDNGGSDCEHYSGPDWKEHTKALIILGEPVGEPVGQRIGEPW